MILYFYNRVVALKLTEFEAFQTAYMAIFQKEGHVTPDYCEFELHRHEPWYDLPPYVKKWLATLQENEHGSSEVLSVLENREDNTGGTSVSSPLGDTARHT